MTTRGSESGSLDPTTLRAQATRSSSRKVAQPVGGPDASQGTMPLCFGTPILSEGGGEIDIGWRIGGVGGVGGKPRVA